jgi:hypothetical protein
LIITIAIRLKTRAEAGALKKDPGTGGAQGLRSGSRGWVWEAAGAKLNSQVRAVVPRRRRFERWIVVFAFLIEDPAAPAPADRWNAEARPMMAGPLISRRVVSSMALPQWCQNSASKMMIGSGIPSNQRSKPLPRPTGASNVRYVVDTTTSRDESSMSLFV